MSGDNSSRIVWFLAGASIGAAVALLFAPESGAQTRRRISRKTGEGYESLTDSGKEILGVIFISMSIYRTPSTNA